MTRVMLINPFPYYASGIEGVIYPPLGLLYMSSLAKTRKLAEIKVLDANIMKMGNEEVVSRIIDYKPDIIGVSGNIVTHKSAMQLLQLIREKSIPGLMLVGGPNPAIFAEKYLEYCDIVVKGEGEETFCDILERHNAGKDFSSVQGIIYKKGNSVTANLERPYIPDLNKIPFPDYDALIPGLDEYSRRSRVVKKVMAPLLTSRGCPYLCTYCNKTVFGAQFRARSPENIIGEIEWLNKRFSVDQIDILDDNFNLVNDRAERILDLILDKDIPLAISCHNGLRVDKVTESFAIKLKKSGVFKVGLGIESGDSALLDKTNKNLDLNKVKSAISILRKQGITVHGYFILGLPGDTPETMQRTIKFAKMVNPHFCNFAICIPFPGTAVYNQIKEKGRFLDDVDNGVSSGFFDGKVFFEIDGTKAKDVAAFYKKAYRDFYFNIPKAFDILFSIRNFKEFIWIMGMSLSVVFNMAGKLTKSKK